MAETTTAAAEERQFVAHFSQEQHILPPEEIQQNPRNKELGGTSRSLSARDFDLIRTLGTGETSTIICAVLCSFMTECACNVC